MPRRNGTKTKETTARPNSGSEEKDGCLEKGLNGARSHWIQCYKVNVQVLVVVDSLVKINLEPNCTTNVHKHIARSSSNQAYLAVFSENRCGGR
jgi:hypothetical protein